MRNIPPNHTHCRVLLPSGRWSGTVREEACVLKHSYECVFVSNSDFGVPAAVFAHAYRTYPYHRTFHQSLLRASAYINMVVPVRQW